MNKSKRYICTGSGRTVRADAVLRGKVACPKCGRLLKPRLATGGYEGYARHVYLPHHKEPERN